MAGKQVVASTADRNVVAWLERDVARCRHAHDADNVVRYVGGRCVHLCGQFLNVGTQSGHFSRVGACIVAQLCRVLGNGADSRLLQPGLVCNGGGRRGLLACKLSCNGRVPL